MANEIIQRLDLAQENRILTVDELQLRKDLKCRVLGLAGIERSRQRQASRQIWLKEGDACTKFFHLKANGRAKKNFIHCLRKTDARYVWSHPEKEEILFKHFEEWLGTREGR
jgi:hypothetical protein